MKNLNINRLFWTLFLSVFAIIGLSSCRDDSSDDSKAGPPVIEKITGSLDGEGKPVDLTPITQAQANNTVIIHGSGFKTLQHVYFNETESAFNPNFVTDNVIVVKINENTPYANASNKLKLVTAFGEVVYDFTVAPPSPEISSYNSINAQAGETFKIYGKYFLNPEVKVGTATATIVSSTLTEIVAIMPANANDKYVSVTTISGTSTAAQAVGSALYDDEIQGDAGHWTWSGTPIITDFADDTFQGKKAMKIAFGGWDGADFKFNSRNVSQYKAFRIRVKSTVDNSSASLKMVFGGWAFQIVKPVTTGWTYIEIPFSEIGNPTTFDQITFQESGNFGGNTLLIDDMGFVLK